MEPVELSKASPTGDFRKALLSMYTFIFITCFVEIAVCLYYLSALALDSFDTSAVFAGILVTSAVLMVSSVWGCHRTKYIRSHSSKFVRRSFVLFFAVLFGIFVAWTVLTRRTYDLIAEIESEPLSYWDSNRGQEAKLLYNFALEFEDMWESGNCTGNTCAYSDCRGSPVVATPLECSDRGMLAQFNAFIGAYSDTADELRDCVNVVVRVLNTTIAATDFPVLTWCQARLPVLDSARICNGVMFWLVLFQSVCILCSIPVMWHYGRLVLRDKGGSLRDRFFYRSSLTDSKWFRSQPSDDEDRRPNNLGLP